MTRRYTRYTEEFRTEVLALAEKRSVHYAAATKGVPISTIHTWRYRNEKRQIQPSSVIAEAQRELKNLDVRRKALQSVITAFSA